MYSKPLEYHNYNQLTSNFNKWEKFQPKLNVPIFFNDLHSYAYFFLI